MSIKKKIDLLTQIGSELNKNNIIWAVGGSLLLFLKGKVKTFQDIDLMVYEADAIKTKEILQQKGTIKASKSSDIFRSKYFFEFEIDGIEIDMIAGFVIVYNEEVYDCSLQPESIKEYQVINGVSIPLQSLEEWRKYYFLMGKMDKVKLFDTVI